VSQRRRSDSPTRTGAPAPLLVAASLVAVEGALVLLLAVLELRSLDAARASMAITTALFFAGYGALLLACARSVTRGRSWARSPIVLAQLIQLGVAWNYRSSPTTLLALGLAVVAAVVVAGLLHPASVEALADRPDRP
jgi:hypothetical protein